MSRERILVTVKTYPTLSRKYGELVCTAGVRDDGSWVRLYPVSFRRLNEEDRYKKFDWIEAELVRNSNDPRPETYYLRNQDDLEVVGHIDTRDHWSQRRRLLLRPGSVFEHLTPLKRAAKVNAASLAVFKPSEVVDFVWEPCTREWEQSKVEAMRQGDLFRPEEWRKTFQLVGKLPYDFSYRFRDADGKRSELQVLDWECGALYWKCLERSGGNEAEALAKVKAKYLDEFSRKDLHFFLGTLRQFHGVSPNPWVIVGVFPIPHEEQPSLW